MAAGAAGLNATSAAWAFVQREMEETDCCCHTNDHGDLFGVAYTSGCCTCESCAAANPTCASYCSTSPSESMKRESGLGNDHKNRGGVCCPASQYGCRWKTGTFGGLTEFFSAHLLAAALLQRRKISANKFA